MSLTPAAISSSSALATSKSRAVTTERVRVRVRVRGQGGAKSRGALVSWLIVAMLASFLIVGAARNVPTVRGAVTLVTNAASKRAKSPSPSPSSSTPSSPPSKPKEIAEADVSLSDGMDARTISEIVASNPALTPKKRAARRNAKTSSAAAAADSGSGSGSDPNAGPASHDEFAAAAALLAKAKGERSLQ